MIELDDHVLPAGRLLRKAALELDVLSKLLRSVEELVCDVLVHQPALAPGRAKDIQAFDLLGQRLRGLSSCLATMAQAAEGGESLTATRLAAVLPLASQRAALLDAAQEGETCVAAIGTELF